jgi:hypothetical protein
MLGESMLASFTMGWSFIIVLRGDTRGEEEMVGGIAGTIVEDEITMVLLGNANGFVSDECFRDVLPLGSLWFVAFPRR